MITARTSWWRRNHVLFRRSGIVIRRPNRSERDDDRAKWDADRYPGASVQIKVLVCCTYQRWIKRRAVNSDAGIRILIGGWIRSSINADSRGRKSRVGQRQPGRIVLTGTYSLPWNRIRHYWSSVLAARSSTCGRTWTGSRTSIRRDGSRADTRTAASWTQRTRTRSQWRRCSSSCLTRNK